MKEVFNLEPYHRLYKESGVHRISYFYIELADYVRKRIKELKEYIRITSLPEKKIFLRVFFDDEGSVRYDKKRNKRQVRGFQYNLEVLKLIQKLLKDFDIQSKIDEKYKEIVISRKENLIKFRDKINFSKGVYINPNRKNSIWKQKLEKREILDRIIDSYQRI
jgi:intein-encoded DNA endonuclease-like protein